jgi:hypothetical protein
MTKQIRKLVQVKWKHLVLFLYKACFIRRIVVASNAIKTIDNEMINLIKLHYLLFELHSTRPKFDV